MVSALQFTFNQRNIPSSELSWRSIFLFPFLGVDGALALRLDMLEGFSKLGIFLRLVREVTFHEDWVFNIFKAWDFFFFALFARFLFVRKNSFFNMMKNDLYYSTTMEAYVPFSLLRESDISHLQKHSVCVQLFNSKFCVNELKKDLPTLFLSSFQHALQHGTPTCRFNTTLQHAAPTRRFNMPLQHSASTCRSSTPAPARRSNTPAPARPL